MDLTKQTTINISRGEAYELFANIGFRKHSTSFLVSTQPVQMDRLFRAVRGGYGREFLSGSDARAAPAVFGKYAARELWIHLAAVIRFRLDETLIYYRLGTRDGSGPLPFSPGQSVFNNYLNRAKLNYQFTKELSLRLILDYNATIANTQLFDLQRSLAARMT